MAGENLRSVVEVAGDAAQAMTGLVAEAHQPVGHGGERRLLLVDPLAKDAEQALQAAGLAAQGSDRAHELLRLAAASPAENQPGEPD